MVFAKAPVAGNVKTRLVPPLSFEQAAALHEAFVSDTVESLQSLTGCVSIELHTDIETDAWPALIVPRRIQHGRDLGLKMLNAITEALSRGHPLAMILGSDSPTLPGSYLDAILRIEADVVFGPATDGGYYAIAARTTDQAMFDNVPWSSSETLVDTVRACRAAGLTTALGPEWFDVDSVADLERLALSPDLPRHTRMTLRPGHGERGQQTC